jgi:hypothetical protein
MSQVSGPKFSANNLMAAVFIIWLLTIEPESLEDGGVLHRKQPGLLMTVVCVLVPDPWWDDERIAGFPFELLAVDNAISFSPEDVVDGTVRLPMRSSSDPSSDELYPTGHGRQHRPTGVRIDIFQRHIIEGVGARRGQLAQGLLCTLPFVVEQGGMRAQQDAPRWGTVARCHSDAASH